MDLFGIKARRARRELAERRRREWANRRARTALPADPGYDPAFDGPPLTADFDDSPVSSTSNSTT